MIENAQRLHEQNGSGGDFGFKLTKASLLASGLNKCGFKSVTQMVSSTKATAYRTSKCRAGDIALFSNQFDQNENSQNDDRYTGSGVIIRTQRKTLTIATATGSQTRTILASPAYSDVYNSNGTQYNSFARPPSPIDADNSQYLAGQLFDGCLDIEVLASSCQNN